MRHDNLSSRCLEGTTQNPYEAFNQIIWKKCPRDIFTSRHVLKIGVASAVINFNDGFMGLSRIFQSPELSFGKYSVEGALDKDIKRIIKMDKKTQEINKNIRKKKRAVRKEYIDREHEQEGGESYISGNFLMYGNNDVFSSQLLFAKLVIINNIKISRSVHRINLKFSDDILQYLKQGLNQNYVQKVIFPYFLKKLNNKF